MGPLTPLVAIALSYLVLGVLSLHQLHINHYVAGFWFPSGLVTAIAVNRSQSIRWLWPGLFVGEFIIGGIYSPATFPGMALGEGLSVSLQALTVGYLANHFLKGQNPLQSIENLGKFLLIALGGAILHTTIGGWFIPRIFDQPSLPLIWLVGGYCGTISLAPLILSWMTRSEFLPFKIPWKELGFLVLVALGTLHWLNSPIIEDIRGLWITVHLGLVVWGALRYPPPLATAINFFMVQLYFLWPPEVWIQIMSQAPEAIRFTNIQILLASNLIVALIVSVFNGDRQRITQALQTANHRLQTQLTQQSTALDQAEAELAKAALSITEALPVGTYTMVLPPGGDMAHFSFMSDRFLALCGLDRETAARDPMLAFACVHPDDLEAWVALNAETFAQKKPFFGETRLIVGGQVRWIRAESVPRDLEDGSTVWEGVLTDITDTKTYQQQLQQAYGEIQSINQDLENRVHQRTAELETSRSQFQRLVEDIGDKFVIFSHTGSTGIMTYVSGGFEAIFGIPSEAILGKSWITEINWTPETLISAQKSFETLRSGQAPTQTLEMTFIRPDRQRRTIKVLGHPVWNETGALIAIEGVLEDITRRKQFIANLAASEAKFRTFIETANDLIFSLDLQGRFTYLSPNTVEVLGFSPAELTGLSYHAIVHPEDIAQCDQVFYTVLQGEKVRGLEYRVRQKDDSWRWHSTSVSPQLNAKGTVVAVLGFAYDCTDRKLAQLRQEQANQELWKANQLKDEFLAMMSHELRTPLNAVLGMAEGLEEELFGPLNDRQKTMLHTIQRSGSHLLSLINDILDLSKIQAGHLTLDIHPTRVESLMETSLLWIHPQALNKHLTIVQRLDPDLPPVLMDERRMRQVLLNLLSNAIKFTPEGGQITLGGTRIQGEDNACYVRLTVEDTGIGIAPEHIDKLFQPFCQIDSALNRHYEGTGLGLSLVKRLVSLQGGEVGVISAPGQGSCFWLTLPCGQGSALSSPRPADLDGVPPSPKAILLVASDPRHLLSVESYLEAKGYQPLVAPLDQTHASAQAHTPQCVLLMVDPLKASEGLPFVQAYRQEASLAHTPILLSLVQDAEDFDPHPYLQAGVNAYLAPPLKLRELVEKVEQALSPR